MSTRKIKTNNRWVGARFGRLIVQRVASHRGVMTYWLCRCDCGAELIVSNADLKKGYTVSCDKAECIEKARRPKPEVTYAVLA